MAAMVCLFTWGTVSHAALLTGNAVASPTIPANLTEIGTTDWAYWNSTSSTGVTSMAPGNVKSGGPGVIGPATNIGGTGVRGSTTDTAIQFTFTDGTSPTSGTGLAVPGVFNVALTGVNTGVQVIVTLPDTQLYDVAIWVSGFNSTGTFTALLPGATNFSDASFTYGSGTKPARLYELQVQADQPGDSLTLRYVMTASHGASSHVLIAGVALAVIPEPASLLLLSGAGLLLLPRRSRA